MGTRLDRRHTCKHFNGIQNEYCEAGVRLHDKRDVSRPGMATWPCLDVTCPTTCEKREELTDAEFEAQEREIDEAVARMVGKLNAFDRRETEDCPQCGQPVECLRQVGRCVYASPCNCRVWQGTIPTAWKNA